MATFAGSCGDPAWVVRRPCLGREATLGGSCGDPKVMEDLSRKNGITGKEAALRAADEWAENSAIIDLPTRAGEQPAAHDQKFATGCIPLVAHSERIHTASEVPPLAYRE